MKKRLTMFLAGIFLCLGSALAQTKVSGVVIGATDNEPVIGATVTVAGTKIATVTDMDGKFSLSVNESNPKVTISYIGMVTQTLKGTTNMKVLLKSDAQLLSDVVVTGLTKTDRRLFTGATDKVDASKARLSGVADISRSLEGQAAGVSVQNVSGTFGSAPKIRVRGATSIYGSSKPLWVVDGVIMEDVSNVGADDLASGNPETLISSAIAGLNSDDIESFQILKDGSATSIYGARAMAGVIVVTTKKGKQGQAHFNYTGEFTSRLVPSYSNFDILNSQDQMGIYRELKDKGWLNYSDVLNGKDYGVYGKMYELINTYDPATQQFKLAHTTLAQNQYLREAEYRNTDWFSLLFSPAIMQNHSVSMNGGTAKSNYYASMSAMLDPGWYKQSNVNRYTANFNVTHQILNNLSLNVIGGASYRKQRAPGSLEREVDAVNGTVVRDFDINPYSYALNTSRALDPNETYVLNYAPFNVFHELENNYIDLNVLDAKFQFELKYKPIKDLELAALGAFKYATTSQEHKVFDTSNQAEAYRAMPNAIIRDKNYLLYTDPDKQYSKPYTILPNGGIYHKGENRMSDYDFRVTANYNHTFDKAHIVNLFGGMETTEINRTKTFFEGWGMQFDAGETPFYVYDLFKRQIERSEVYYTLNNTHSFSQAFFANATYSYKGKYVANGTYRYEGSNQMGRSKQARWMSTWNVSGSWNVHEEKWFDKLKPLSHLTLRTSYSLTGTPPATTFSNPVPQLRSTTPYRRFASIKEPAIEIYKLGNSSLTYEKKNELNFGVDLGLLHDRLNVTFDVYTRNNFDEMGYTITEGIGGEVERAGNIAQLHSNGMELSVSSTNIKTKDFSWVTSFIYSYTNTEITKLHNYASVRQLVNGSGFALKGYPVRSLFSVPFVGLTEEGLPMFLNENNEVTTTNINLQERQKLDFLKYEGPTDPIYTGSLGNVFSYKGFHLNVFMTYSFGNVLRLDPVFKAAYNDLSSMTKVFRNRWMRGGDELTTNVPTIIDRYRNKKTNNIERAYSAYNLSNVRVAKGDFIRLKEVSLTYDFPKAWLSSTPINNLSLKLQATNLCLLYADSKLNGQDPEFFNAGGVASPMPKQFTLTVKVGL